MSNDDPRPDDEPSGARDVSDAPPTIPETPATAQTPDTEVMAPTEEVSPTPETPETPNQPDGGRRRRLMVVAAIVAMVVVTAVIAALAAGDDPSTTAGTTSVPSATTTTDQRPSTTRHPTTASTVAPTITAAPTPSVTVEPAPSGLPDDPNAYAVAAFEAWQEGDLATLAELAAPSVTEFLTAASPDDGWDDPRFEGAAGSTYATWGGPDGDLVLRVANQYATVGDPHALHGAFFTTAAGRVAIWPLTTQVEADELQQQVDQGHQPWHVDQEAVAAAYAQARLGWQDATVETTDPGRCLVTDPGTGTQAAITLAQPARAGSTGIWVVTDAGSV
jgi:hypothetical protein